MSENNRKSVVVFFNDVVGKLNEDGTLGEEVPGAFDWLEEVSEYFDVSVYSETSTVSDLQKWFFDKGLDMGVYRELSWCDSPPTADYIVDYNVVHHLGELPKVRDLRLFNASIGRIREKEKTN